MALSLLSRLILVMFISWVLIYGLAYYFIMNDSPDDKSNEPPKISQDILKIDDNPLKSTIQVNSRQLFEKPLENPFLSPGCRSRVDNEKQAAVPPSSVAIIMAIKDSNPDDVISSIKSIVAHSSSLLAVILVLDDRSSVPVTEWPHWTLLDTSIAHTVKIIRTAKEMGVAGTKYYGGSLAQANKSVKYLLFIDDPIIVSHEWLNPLTRTIQQYPKSIVYPAIDVISIDGFIRGDNVVGAFDWSLNFVWEPFDRSRMPLLPTILSNGLNIEDMPTPSPSAPDVFAMSVEFYNEIGGFEKGLHYRSWGLNHDSIELSLRVWLCGGQIIKESCSRVAKKFPNLFNDANAGRGVSEAIIDHDVMALAERYMRPSLSDSNDYKETVFQARFTGGLIIVEYRIRSDECYCC